MAIFGWIVLVAAGGWLTGAALAASWWALKTTGKLDKECAFLLIAASAAIVMLVKLKPFVATVL